jgi:uncharacterized membrane protein
MLAIYNTLPAALPLHFGIDGQPDRYGSRNEFILVVLLLQVVAAFTFLLIKFLPRIDPKRKARYSQSAFIKLSFALLLFISFINVAVIYNATQPGFKMNKLVFPMIGLLFAYMGNMMHSIKPNYFVGIRTPWTLESEDTWRKTHQLAGKIWLPGGLIIAIICLLLPPRGGTIFFAITVAVMALIPVVYSYIYFKKHQPNSL